MTRLLLHTSINHWHYDRGPRYNLLSVANDKMVDAVKPGDAMVDVGQSLRSGACPVRQKYDGWPKKCCPLKVERLQQ